ncbi:MAG: hypothetical protein Q8Q50_16035 [Methylobacter sp.]|nr:hypothetical protein [Methylobacter sp.]
MSSITEQLFTVLHNVQRSGQFYTTGTLEIFPPQLAISVESINASMIWLCWRV